MKRVTTTLPVAPSQPGTRRASGATSSNHRSTLTPPVFWTWTNSRPAASETITAAQAGMFKIELLASMTGMSPAPRFHIEIDGADVTGALDVPDTGGWSVFQAVGKGGIAVSAGAHVLRIVSQQQWFNIDSIRITADTTPPLAMMPPAAPRGFGFR